VVEKNTPITRERFAFDTAPHGRPGIHYFDLRIARFDDGFASAWNDVTERTQAEEVLQHSYDELELRVQERTAELQHLSTLRQELLQRLVTAQEDERRHIARELHDSLGQYLSALTLGLAQVQMAADCPPDVLSHLARLQAITSEIDAELDRLTIELHPPALDDLGLNDALARYAQEWNAMRGIPVEVVAIGFDAARLPLAVESAAYRIVQEALTNVHKHAQADHVSVIATRGSAELRVIVEDDGVGFDPETVRWGQHGRRQLGLVGMTERAALAGGAITVESEPGGGTTIYLHFPLGAVRPGGADG